jgi:hypothetical protein
MANHLCNISLQLFPGDAQLPNKRQTRKSVAAIWRHWVLLDRPPATRIKVRTGAANAEALPAGSQRLHGLQLNGIRRRRPAILSRIVSISMTQPLSARDDLLSLGRRTFLRQSSDGRNSRTAPDPTRGPTAPASLARWRRVHCGSLSMCCSQGQHGSLAQPLQRCRRKGKLGAYCRSSDWNSR